jgi:hypothetical protein
MIEILTKIEISLHSYNAITNLSPTLKICYLQPIVEDHKAPDYVTYFCHAFNFDISIAFDQLMCRDCCLVGLLADLLVEVDSINYIFIFLPMYLL